MRNFVVGLGVFICIVVFSALLSFVITQLGYLILKVINTINNKIYEKAGSRWITIKHIAMFVLVIIVLIAGLILGVYIVYLLGEGFLEGLNNCN